MNANVISSGIRYAIAIVGTLVTAATTMGLLNADTAHKLVDAVQQLGTALGIVVVSVTTIITLIQPVIGMIKSTHAAHLAAVKSSVASGAISKSEAVATIQNTRVTPPVQ